MEQIFLCMSTWLQYMISPILEAVMFHRKVIPPSCSLSVWWWKMLTAQFDCTDAWKVNHSWGLINILTWLVNPCCSANFLSFFGSHSFFFFFAWGEMELCPPSLSYLQYFMKSYGAVMATCGARIPAGYFITPNHA